MGKQITKKSKGQEYFEKYGYAQYIKDKMIAEDVDKPIRIIGEFANACEYRFGNYEQIQRFISRTIKIARRLDCYPVKQIRATIDYLKSTADYKFTLETVEKYILEDLDKLSGDESIITLSNGEKVYDVARLKELEDNKIIFYDDGWREHDKQGV